MSIARNTMQRLHTVLFQALLDEKRITIEDLGSKIGLDKEQMQEWFAERIAPGAEYVTWRNILQYVGHTNEAGEWIPYPDNWFWAAIYSKPYYRYQDNLALHAQYHAIQNAEYANWRKKNEGESNSSK